MNFRGSATAIMVFGAMAMAGCFAASPVFWQGGGKVSFESEQLLNEWKQVVGLYAVEKVCSGSNCAEPVPRHYIGVGDGAVHLFPDPDLLALVRRVERHVVRCEGTEVAGFEASYLGADRRPEDAGRGVADQAASLEMRLGVLSGNRICVIRTDDEKRYVARRLENPAEKAKELGRPIPGEDY